MKTKKAILIVLCFVCLVLVTGWHFITGLDVERAYLKGEQLSISELGSKEEIVASTLFAHRSAIGREYRIRREGARRIVAIFDTTPAWARVNKVEKVKLLGMRDLAEREIRGLDETIAYCRRAREETSSATAHIRLRYFRNGKPIGEEFYIGFGLTSQLAYYDEQGMLEDPNYKYDYMKLAEQYRVSVDQVYRMVPFETLEHEL